MERASERRRRGTLIATALEGSWRAQAQPAALSAAAWDDIGDLLISSGSGGLAQQRLDTEARARANCAPRLADAYRMQVLQGALDEAEIARALAALAARGIRPVLFKGFAASLCYSRPGLRPFGDLDLLVAGSELEAAQATLRGSPVAGRLDLHITLPFLDDRAKGQVGARLVELRVGDSSVSGLGPEDHLRLVALHCLAHGAWRPLWLCDLAAALESMPPGIDWDYFLSGVRSRRGAAVCALVLAGRLLAADLSRLPRALAERRLPSWLTTAILAAWGSRVIAHGTRAPFGSYLSDPRGVFSALAARWPSPIEATIGVRAPWNSLPRLPFQAAECARRLLGFLLAGGGRATTS